MADLAEERKDLRVLLHDRDDRIDDLIDLGSRDREGRQDLEDVPLEGRGLADDSVLEKAEGEPLAEHALRQDVGKARQNAGEEPARFRSREPQLEADE